MNFTLWAAFLVIAFLAWLFLYKKHKAADVLQPAGSNVYVIRSHIWNAYVKSVFLQMQQQLGPENVFLLFDTTNAVIQEPHIEWNNEKGVYKGPAIITINEKDCAAINKLHIVGDRPGSEHRVEAHVSACYKAIKKDYDYLWFIEYDVYSNNYKDALHPFHRNKADMLTTLVKSATTKKKWFWWPFIIGELSYVPLKERKGCFFPINRFSKAFLSVLEQNLSKSSGYCEVYFPTLCVVNGLTLASIPSKALATFRSRPVLSGKEFKKIKQTDNRLYHPVKEITP